MDSLVTVKSTRCVHLAAVVLFALSPFAAAAELSVRIKPSTPEQRRTVTQPAPQPSPVPAPSEALLEQTSAHLTTLLTVLKSGKQPEAASVQRLEELLLKLLADEDRRRCHNALLILRDQFSSPRLVHAAAAALDRMLQKQAANWDEGCTRMVACEVLNKHPDVRSIPALLKAFGDPFRKHFFIPGPRNHVSHSYHTIWWAADAALRAITQAEPVKRPSTDSFFETGEQEHTLAA